MAYVYEIVIFSLKISVLNEQKVENLKGELKINGIKASKRHYK
jgi:hypothetical protein